MWNRKGVNRISFLNRGYAFKGLLAVIRQSMRMSVNTSRDNLHLMIKDAPPRITCYRELGGSGNSEVNNGRQIRLGPVFILFCFQFTSTLEILTYRTYKV